MKRMRPHGPNMGLAAWIALASCGMAVGCGDHAEDTTHEEGPVSWEVSARADKTEVQVGEALDLTVTVRHPPQAEFLIPSGANLEPFELVERIEEPHDSPVESRVTLRIAAYRLPAKLEIPSLEIEYRDEHGERAALRTEPIPVEVVTSLTPDVTEIHDIKGPIADLPVPSPWRRLWWLLAAVLVALLAYVLYRRWARRAEEPKAEAPPPPLLPPAEEAERALRALAGRRLVEQDRHKEFYVALSEILKRYAGRRFDVAYLERTTAEILLDLHRVSMTEDVRSRLRRVLETADLVKFARVIPPGEDSQRMVPEAFRFVDETRPRPAVTPQPTPAAAEVSA